MRGRTFTRLAGGAQVAVGCAGAAFAIAMLAMGSRPSLVARLLVTFALQATVGALALRPARPARGVVWLLRIAASTAAIGLLWFAAADIPELRRDPSYGGRANFQAAVLLAALAALSVGLTLVLSVADR